MGRRYTLLNSTGSYVTGSLDPAPLKSPNLLDGSGKFFERSKPQYESKAASSFIIATENGVHGCGTCDQTNAINTLFFRVLAERLFSFRPVSILWKEQLIFLQARLYWGRAGHRSWALDHLADEKNPQVMVQCVLPWHFLVPANWGF